MDLRDFARFQQSMFSPEDWGYRLGPDSPCIDAGGNALVPADELDIDGDGDTAEPILLDLDGNPRFKGDPTAPDTGVGTPPIVDMRAYEFQRGCLNTMDCDNGLFYDGVEEPRWGSVTESEADFGRRRKDTGGNATERRP